MYCSGQRNGENATVAQLVEYDLAKVGVAGSSPVCRSEKESSTEDSFFRYLKNCIRLYTCAILKHMRKEKDVAPYA